MSSILSYLHFVSLLQFVITLDQMHAPTYTNLRSTSFDVAFIMYSNATEYYVTLTERHSSRVRIFRVTASGETISNLDQNKLYDVTVRALDKNGTTSLDSPSAKVYTLPGPPSLRVPTLLPDTVFVFFVLERNSRVSQWQIRYFDVTNTANVITVNTTEGNYFAHILTGLSPQTTYMIQARALKVNDFTRELTEEESDFSQNLNFMTGSLAVFGKVTLQNVAYESDHSDSNSDAFASVQSEIEGAYNASGIQVNGSLTILKIVDETKAVVHFRIDVANSTGYNIPSSAFVNKESIFTLNGDSQRANIRIDEIRNTSTFLIMFAGIHGDSNCVIGNVASGLLLYLDNMQTFEVRSIDKLTGSKPILTMPLHIHRRNDGIVSVIARFGELTIQPSVTVGIIPKFYIEHCPTYDLIYYPTKWGHKIALQPFLSTTGAGTAALNQTDYSYEPKNDSCGVLLVPAHDKILKYEIISNKTNSTVGILNEEDLDASSRWKVDICNLDPGNNTMIPRVTFRTHDDLHEVIEGHGFIINSLFTDCEMCSNHSTCLREETSGDAECTCSDHFTGNGSVCFREMYCTNTSCDVNANCNEIEIFIDGEDNFRCVCHSGYRLVGSTCEDIDECNPSNTNNCSLHATCNNTVGSYNCNCSAGFTGDGFDCEDIDECIPPNTYNCSYNAICTNNIGSYTCSFPCSLPQWINEFQFPPTQPQLVSYSMEMCPGNENVPLASISCSGEFTYDLGSFKKSDCQSIADVINQIYSNKTFEALHFATSNVSSLTVESVNEISKYLEEVSVNDIEFSAGELDDAVQIFSHLTEHYQQISAADSTEIVSSSERQDVVTSLSRITRKLKSDSSNFSSVSQDLNVEVRDITFVNSSYTFETKFFQNQTANSAFSPVVITIPAEAFNKAKSSSFVRIVSVGFRSSVLFPSPRTAQWVISSSLGNSTDSVEGITLIDPIVIRNNEIQDLPGEKPLTDFKSELTIIECVFWDFKIGDWSGEGCSLLPGVPATCHCNHLTNFAILVSRSEIPADITLSIISRIGCGLSVVGFFFTLACICSLKNLRSRYQMQIYGNICFCSGVSYGLFLLGVDYQIGTIVCTILAVLMHYFFLTAWCWTCVYSFALYRDLSQIMVIYGRSFNIKLASAFAFGIPAVIVLVNVGIALGHIDVTGTSGEVVNSSYTARNFCWLNGDSLYFGFLLPVGILMLFNIFVLCSIIPKITCRRIQVQSTMAKRTLKHNVTLTFTLASTMMLAWISGYFLLISDNEVYLLVTSWIFTLTNSFQGVFIFCNTIIRTRQLGQVPIIKKLSELTSTLSSRFSARQSEGSAATRM